MTMIKFNPQEEKFKRKLKHILHNMVATPPKNISKSYAAIMRLVKPIRNSKKFDSWYTNIVTDILEKEFPKGECQERGNALVLISLLLIELHRKLNLTSTEKKGE